MADVREELASALKAHGVFLHRVELGDGETAEYVHASDFVRVVGSLSARAAVPEGWQLVPVKPTKFMMDAAIPPGRQDQTGRREFSIWQAMLAAAPQPEATCTCPSGDGSLRHPCPAHPSEDAPASTAKEATKDAHRRILEYGAELRRRDARAAAAAWNRELADLMARKPEGCAMPEAAQTAGDEVRTVRVECWQCDDCGWVGFNDLRKDIEACFYCDWNGPAPIEDKCPGCGHGGTMTAACPKCSGRYTLLADDVIHAPPEPAPSAPSPGDALSLHGAAGRSASRAPADVQEMAKPMTLEVAFDFADNPRPYHSLACPADTNSELYRALKVLAAETRSLSDAQQAGDGKGGA